MSSYKLFISSSPCTCADATDYVRSLLCATLLVGSVAVQCRSLTSFITQASKPSLDLFPRKCTYAQVIDFGSRVLWSIGFIANRYRVPPTKLACPLLYEALTRDVGKSKKCVACTAYMHCNIVATRKPDKGNGMITLNPAGCNAHRIVCDSNTIQSCNNDDKVARAATSWYFRIGQNDC